MKKQSLKDEKVKKKASKKNNGITLIAFVITIIVLLILAGVTIATLTGDNGILTRASDARENTRGGEVQEFINITLSENEIANNTTGSVKSKYKVIQELYKSGKLTDEEVKELENSDFITIGNVNVDFSRLEDIVTLGDVYTEEMIGQKITYSSNNVSDWIVFGKDANENILITSSNPLNSDITLESGALGWLRYEDELTEKCSVYGGEVQGKTVTSRSIKLEDINNITKVETPEKENVTFGMESAAENHKYSLYFPSLEAEGYWQSPQNGSATFYCVTNRYVYNSNYEEMPLNISKSVFGDNTDFSYLLQDKSILVDNNIADFSVAVVNQGALQSHWYAYYYGICYSNATKGYNYGTITSNFSNIRPIVILPSSIQVEKNSESLWDIK